MEYIIDKKIEYLPSSEKPLSAEVFIVHMTDATYVFDVGASDEALETVNQITSPKRIVISHFHEDHMGNIKRINLQQEDVVYGGDFTGKKVPEAVVVKERISMGPDVDIFPIPSSHSKGCLGLRCGEYAFLGDSTYAFRKDGQIAYNVSVLHETIRVLEELPAQKFVLSHKLPEIREKESVLNELREIYKLRRPGEAYII